MPNYSKYFYAFSVDVRRGTSIMEIERAIKMLDDYKYSIGRLVVYKHTDPKLPRQSYGHSGPDKTVGEVLAVDVVPNPAPHWVYTVANARNSEVTRVEESKIEFAVSVGKRWKKTPRRSMEQNVDDSGLAEMIAKALSNPVRESFLQSTLKELLFKEELASQASREGPNLPVDRGDYIRVRGDLRRETEEINNQYAKILSVEPTDIAGIENASAKPGQSTLYRTLKRFGIITSEGIKAEIYDAEIKLFYTAHGRKTVLNWRAATLLAEVFKDEPPYNIEYEYMADHVFTRDEIKTKSRGELAQMLAALLYVKGRMGWRDYQRRNQFFAGTPKNHLVDSILQASRFDSKRNRPMTIDEIRHSKQDGYKLRRLLKSR